VDVDTGNVRWKAQVPYPAQGAARFDHGARDSSSPAILGGVVALKLRPARNAGDQYRLVDLCTIFPLICWTAINT